LREENAILVVATLLLIVIIGVMFPIYGDINSIPGMFVSAWVGAKEYAKNIINSEAAGNWLFYAAAGALILVLLSILIKLIKSVRKKRPPRRKSTRIRRFRVRVRKAYRGIIAYIFGVIESILNVIRRFLQIILNFFHIVLTLLHITVVIAIIYYIVQSFPEPISAVQSALADSKTPAEFQGLKGGLTLFLFMLLGVTLGFVVLAVLARAFAKIISAGISPQSKIVGWIIAYLLYGVAVILTIAIFSKLAAAVCGVVFFVLIPIVGGLIGLMVDETG
jgi:uncharacterized protein (UPF0333 family)